MAVQERRKSHNPLQKITPAFKILLSFLYPRHCPICDKVLPSSSFLCERCRNKLPLIKEPFCYQCGKPVASPEQELCYDCRTFPKSFKKGLALFLYNEITRPSMTAFKYQNKRILSDFFIQEILSAHRCALDSWNIQGIIPVPVHKHKRKARGYNQAEILAKQLAFHLNLPCYTDLLIRILDTTPQKNFTPQARLNNLTNAFSINEKYDSENLSSLGRILLIDDIYTTGATMEICTRILLSAGVPEVCVYSVCIGTSRD